MYAFNKRFRPTLYKGMKGKSMVSAGIGLFILVLSSMLVVHFRIPWALLFLIPIAILTFVLAIAFHLDKTDERVKRSRKRGKLDSQLRGIIE